MTKENFNDLINDVKELSDLFEQKIVFIGGIATYLYCVENELPEEMSHDADFTISDDDYEDLETLYEDSLHENNRLKKAQIMIRGVDFDVYKGNNSSLLFSHDELVKNSVICQNVSVPALEHLLFLKNVAYENRRESLKGIKDAVDIIKIITIMNKKEIDYDLISNLDTNLKLKLIVNLEDIKSTDLFFDNAAKKDFMLKKQIKKDFNNVINKLKENIHFDLNLNLEIEKNLKEIKKQYRSYERN